MFEQLLNNVRELNLPKGKYALCGSAPIVVKGIREATHDIDIIVTTDVWEEYDGKEGWVKKPSNASEYLEREGKNIELWRDWAPGEWNVEKLIKDAEIIDGLPYVQLDDILKWKKLHGRPKDLEDVRLIEEYLSKSR